MGPVTNHIITTPTASTNPQVLPAQTVTLWANLLKIALIRLDFNDGFCLTIPFPFVRTMGIPFSGAVASKKNIHKNICNWHAG
jgi:hypothetical protein